MEKGEQADTKVNYLHDDGRWITLGHLSIIDGSALDNCISWCLLVYMSSLVIHENRKRGTTNMEFSDDPEEAVS